MQKPTTLPPTAYIPLRSLSHAQSWDTIVSDHSHHQTPPPRHSPPIHADPVGASGAHDDDIVRWTAICRPAKPLAPGQTVVLVPAISEDPIAGTIQDPKKTNLRTMEFWLEITPGRRGEHTITAPLSWCDAPWWARVARLILQPLIRDDPAHEATPNGAHCPHLLRFHYEQALNPTIRYTSFMLTD
ncbi:hypothetical protein FA95DRAFT_1613423 [Auriscalpium vulgare]|uniref:Uncharacterized protein n=1 Tax=Auriscalpium vulgare TaxID=40419 RepID=A0ACB8R2P4_9AGAM|nr:hypothetical protein FA95DRAFT_1613423 [Auriscalpium vulgare]